MEVEIVSNAPIWGLPPDLDRSDIVYAMAPSNLWHLPVATWRPIWDRVDGSNVTVAILDTGKNSHPDLPEPVAARSFISGQSWSDGNGHGTHCAGTAIGRNGIGVSPRSKLMVGKVLSNGGSGGSDGIAAGIRWAAEQGADVLSLSLGGGSPYEPTRRAIDYANSIGCVVVCAAGNAGYSPGRNTIGYPGKFLESLCIGATTSSGGIASFSSGGRELDIATPGQAIISASYRGGYTSMSGTSMATPFAAGLCALIIAKMRSEGLSQLKGVEAWRAFYSKWSEDRGRPGKDDQFGYGVPRASDVIDYLNGTEDWS
jgi:subtilisin family serine protease